MSKLIMIRGNSGSGKTTVATRLQDKFGPNTMKLSHDVIRMDILHVWSTEGVIKSEPLMIELLKYGKKNSEVTIMEGVLPAEKFPLLFQTALQEFGDNIYAYYYDIPFSETLNRHKTKPNCNDFGEPEMRRWWREKNFLGFIPEKVLTQELSVEDAVELIYKDVTGSVNDCIEHE